jgi:hypothetical protein
MKALITLIFLSLLLVMRTLSAQAQESEPVVFEAFVIFESVYTRVAPTTESDQAASVFEDDRLEIISRNLDGTWFEVRRPGRMNSLGWIFYEMIDYDGRTFRPEFLPLGDLNTGVIGEKPLTSAPPFAVYMIGEANLRQTPSRFATIATRVPPLLTVPVVARNQDSSWLKINYLGYEGWIASFSARKLPKVLDIYEEPGLPPLETIANVIIPVELQQGQIDRLREFVTARRELAAGLEGFWWAVFKGEIMPCDAPEEIINYPYTEQDLRELPELGRYMPQLRSAMDSLTTSRDPFEACGIIEPERVYDARNSAINAKVEFDAILERLDVLERDVVQARRLDTK